MGAVGLRRDTTQLPRIVTEGEFVRWAIDGETERGVCYFEHCRFYFEMIEEVVALGTDYKVRFFALAGIPAEEEDEVDRRYPLYWVEHPVDTATLSPQDFSGGYVVYRWCECDLDNDQLGAATLEALARKA